MAGQTIKTGRDECKIIKDGDESKVMNDPIHGLIELDPLCVKIIDTPQFQRLRRIKQLGYCYAIYPAASHTRFEHSIGVCHLAGKLLTALQSRQQEEFHRWEITQEDILCVKIAGLCHDLGHGPFSHLFDQQFIPMVQQKKKKNNQKWTHEHFSADMLKYLKQENDLQGEFDKYGIKDHQIDFIVDLITIPSSEDNWKPIVKKYGKKGFLFDIVSNKRNNIDVDKWDYFARDCHMLGIQNNFDCNRCIQFSRVIEVDGMLQICYRDKEAYNIFEMFHTRNTLHRRAYQHKTNKIMEYMISEAMDLADSADYEGKIKISEAIGDMKEYEHLTDDVIFQIYQSKAANDAMNKARKIIGNIMKRKIYKFVASHLFEQSTWKNITEKKNDIDIVKEIQTGIHRIASALSEGETLQFKPDDIIVQIAKFDYGNEENNPIEKVRFYNKKNNEEAFPMSKERITLCLPEVFQEKEVRVYRKLSDETETADTEKKIFGNIEQAFGSWCIERNCPCEICKNSPKAFTCFMCGENYKDLIDLKSHNTSQCKNANDARCK